MQKSIQPISPETFKKFEKFIKGVSDRKESGSIIGLTQREQIYRIKQLQNKNQLLKIIDLKNYQLEDPQDLDFAKDKKVTYLLIGSDCLIEEKLFLLSYLNNLTKEYPKLSFIFFFQRNITYPWILKTISSYQYLFQNIFFYPAYKEVDQKQFLIYLENKFKEKIPRKVKRLIISECGGYLWLIKEAFRYFIKTKDIHKILEHEEMIFRLKVIYEELDSREKSYFKKFLKQDKYLSQEEFLVAEYFKKVNFSFPILNKFISQQIAKTNSIVLNADRKIVLNSVVTDSFFSKKERVAMRFFLNTPAEVISREEIANTVWGTNTSYTDWALDQFIKRLRSKFVKLGLDRNLIKTIKNHGFIFNQ